MDSQSCGDWEGVPPGLPVRDGVDSVLEAKARESTLKEDGTRRAAD